MLAGTLPENLQLHRVVPRLLDARRWRMLGATLVLTAATALADWKVRGLSLGGLYIFPMLLAATVLSARSVVVFAIVCAALRCGFDDSHQPVQYVVRFFGSGLSYVISGLFVAAVIRNREMAIRHVAQMTREQRLRNEAQERLKTLVESSPAAILTLNAQGAVIAANHAANALLGVLPDSVEGRSIKPYVPMLADAVRFGAGREPCRTAAQTQGRTESGEIFLADVWFSTYAAAEGTQLAAIVVDSSDEMRSREEHQLQQLSTNSRLVVAAVLHEVRNLCGAISVVYSNLQGRNAPCRVEEIQGLKSLVKGLERVASQEFCGGSRETIEVPLRQVLDELRIIIEPAWAEIEGQVSWSLSEPRIRVQADPYGLLQVFMNLAQNSHRAVQGRPVRRLSIGASATSGGAVVRFRDTGPGIRNPQHLFQPFQRGADVTGLGLFISRAIVRSYGGELRFEPCENGACFLVELPASARTSGAYA